MEAHKNRQAILFEEVHKSFEDNHVLNGLSLEIPWRKVTTILGPSGCGKSVTLKHVIGILEADEGRVIVDGQDMSSIRRIDLLELRKRIGVLFQSAALFDSMTVFENVAFGLRMHRRMSEKEIRDRVAVCLNQVDLHDAEETMPVELSGGMRKRAALARAIALEPDFILYDEPTTGLDPRTSNVVGDLILQLQQDLDITSIVVTHDIPLTLRISDKIALIDRGGVAASGSPEEVEQSPIFKKFFEGKLGNLDEA
ncbi:MAG: ABC transporter ATP-binding protein [Gemmatimonadetes bacterium]|nr:ABC transporter ATP-binding protein [Gemmatimonadota bacterium]